MDESGMAVYVSVCGRVERVEVMEMTLDGLCAAVAQRFDIGDRLRFISDEDGEPEVASDDHLRKLAQQRQTVRVLISDNALSDLEQRMWQLRQLQWGFFQDELGRSKNQITLVRAEVKQLRQVVEQSARREVELANELIGERQARENLESQLAERHDAIVQELRREQRARDTAEAALRKDLEDARQTALKYAAASDRAIQEVRSLLGEETRNRGKNIEALLAEWATSQSEVRHSMEAVRAEIDVQKMESDKLSKDIIREASARQAFEQFFGEKVRLVEGLLGKVEGGTCELEIRVNRETDSRVSSSVSQLLEAARVEAQQREMGDKELQEKLIDVARRLDKAMRTIETMSPKAAPASPGPRSPSAVVLPQNAVSPPGAAAYKMNVGTPVQAASTLTGASQLTVSPNVSSVSRVQTAPSGVAFAFPTTPTGGVRTPTGMLTPPGGSVTISAVPSRNASVIATTGTSTSPIQVRQLR